MTRWRYSPAPESTDVVSIDDTYGLYVGGEFVDPRSQEYFKTINPATEEVLAAIPVAGSEDIDLAVQAAREAGEGWVRTSPPDRA